MAAEATNAASQLVGPATVPPFSAAADFKIFILYHPDDITDGSINPILDWVHCLRAQQRRNSAVPGIAANGFNAAKFGSDGAGDGTASCLLDPSPGAEISPVGEMVALGISYVAATGALTVMAISESFSVRSSSNSTTWSPETTAEIFTFGDIAGTFQCLRGAWYAFYVATGIMTTTEFSDVFNSRKLHEFVRKADGNFTGPAGIQCMAFAALHTNNTIDAATGTGSFMFFNAPDDGVFYENDGYTSGIEQVVTLSTATSFTTRTHRDEDRFEIEPVGSSVSTTPIGIQSQALFETVNRAPTQVWDIGVCSNSRGVRGNGQNYGDGLIGDPELKPFIIGVDNIAFTNSGINIGTFFTGTSFTSGSPTALHSLTVEGEKSDLGRVLWNSTSGSNPTGNGMWLNEGEVISAGWTHAAGTGFDSIDDPSSGRAFALSWPNGGGRLLVSRRGAATQAAEGTEIEEIGVVDCYGTPAHVSGWNTGAGYAYSQGLLTVTIPDDITDDIDDSMWVSITTADGLSVRGLAKIDSIALDGGDTVITIKRELMLAPNDTDLVAVGPCTLIPLEVEFDGTENVNFRKIHVTALATYGPAVVTSIGFRHATATEGFVVHTFGCSGSGYELQINRFCDPDNILPLQYAPIDAMFVFPAQQSSATSSLSDIIAAIRTNNPNTDIALCTDPQHGNWIAENHEAHWAYMADNAVLENCAFANACNDTRVGDFLEQYGNQQRADTAHISNRGNIILMTAVLDDLMTVMEEEPEPEPEGMSKAKKILLGAIA